MAGDVGGLNRWLRVLLALASLASGYRNRDTRTGRPAFVGGSRLLATAILQRRPVDALLGVDTCPGA